MVVRYNLHPHGEGFCYLVAIMDWASRKVLSFRLSNTLDASFCIEALEEATPEIWNTRHIQHRPRQSVYR